MGTAAHQGGLSMATAAYQTDRPMAHNRSSAEPSRHRQQAQTAGTDSSPSTGGGAAAQSYPYTDAPGMLAPVHQDNGDPRLQLRTQIQQLSELSDLMSQRMTLDHVSDVGPETARARADAVHSPEAADLGPSSAAVIKAGGTAFANGLHSTAQHTQQHDPEESLGDPMVGGGLTQEAAATCDPSTGTNDMDMH